MTRRARDLPWLLVGSILLVGTPVAAAAQAITADSAWSAGQRERARELYRRELERDPDDQTALLRLGLLEAWEDDYDEGIRYLDRLLALNPDRRDAAVARARVLAWNGRRDDAIESLRGVLRRDPNYAAAAEALAQVYTWEDRHDDAVRMYRRAVELEPDDRELRMRLADAYRRAGRLDDAEAVYRHLAATAPGGAFRVRLELARVLAARGERAAARESYAELVEELPVEANAALAELLVREGDYVGGEERWRAALEADPGCVDCMVGLARILRWQGRNEVALQVLREARELEPGAGATERAWARARTGPRILMAANEARDSDENRMGRYSASFAFQPVPRLGISFEGVRLDHEQVTPEFSVVRSATRGEVGLAYRTYLGWSFSGALNRTYYGDDQAEPITGYGVEISTPGRYRFAADLGYEREILDYTAVLLRNRVTMDEGDVGARLRMGGDWELRLAASLANLRTAEGPDNRRIGAGAELGYEPPGPFAYLLGFEGFGYEEDRNDGYYDPETYRKLEATLRWQDRLGVLDLLLEMEPGVRYSRRFGEPGDTSPTIGVGGIVGVFVAPGRRFDVRAGYSRSEPQFGGIVQPGDDGGYEYYNVRAVFTWLF